MSNDCSICCDAYTIQLRKPVTCAYCEYTACSVCIKKYLTSGLLDAHCMGCRRAWNDEFLDMNFTKAFRMGPYKKHREDILLDREIAILPTRQPRVEAKVKMIEVEAEIKEVHKALTEWEIKRQEILRRSAGLSKRLTRYSAESEGRPPPAWTLAEGDKVGSADRAKFVMKCPDGECRGFLSTAYKCGTCQKWACQDCLVIKGKDKDAEHTCEPGVKETVALIIKESKACPKCGERISKIDGCDQMWCVDCHTAFSWTTGQLVNGVVHNPHYYEFLRKQGNGVAPRNAGDVPCGGVPYYHLLQQNTKHLDKPSQVIITGIHRVTAEITDFRLAIYQGHFNVEDNGDLGVKYLMKEIEKDAMKSELVKRELKRNKHLAIRAVLEMFVTTSTMMLNAVVSNPPGEAAIAKLSAVKRKIKDTSAIYLGLRTRSEALAIQMTELRAGADMKELEKEYSALLAEQTGIMDELTKMRTERDEMDVTVKDAAREEFAQTLLAYENLRKYVNDSLMGVSRMKNCSVPQIGDDWTWKPFNKCAPKARVRRAVDAESVGEGAGNP